MSICGKTVENGARAYHAEPNHLLHIDCESEPKISSSSFFAPEILDNNVRRITETARTHYRKLRATKKKEKKEERIQRVGKFSVVALRITEPKNIFRFL